MKIISLIIMALVLATSSTNAFAAPRCRENGKFVKCTQIAAAPAAASIQAPATAPIIKSAPAKTSTGDITVTQAKSSKGKVYNQCRDKKTGRFVKCPTQQ